MVNIFNFVQKKGCIFLTLWKKIGTKIVLVNVKNTLVRTTCWPVRNQFFHMSFFLTFRTLVSIAEKFFSNHYFDQNLIGAQSDQHVLKDLLAHKLPLLNRHLETIDIELSTVTLNWFLAVFFDAVPFLVSNTMISFV